MMMTRIPGETRGIIQIRRGRRMGGGGLMMQTIQVKRKGRIDKRCVGRRGREGWQARADE